MKSVLVNIYAEESHWQNCCLLNFRNGDILWRKQRSYSINHSGIMCLSNSVLNSSYGMFHEYFRKLNAWMWEPKKRGQGTRDTTQPALTFNIPRKKFTPTLNPTTSRARIALSPFCETYLRAWMEHGWYKPRSGDWYSSSHGRSVQIMSKGPGDTWRGSG